MIIGYCKRKWKTTENWFCEFWDLRQQTDAFVNLLYDKTATVQIKACFLMDKYQDKPLGREEIAHVAC